ncbi:MULTISPECIES: hypothetical protein [unclassified Streptomyces]|uniref:hypothetical protein n=1 Tax=unclassified Streptomyces TaxID=2593676 RepID=UPI0022554468|nr:MULTISPECIES: hypothetical protein [unclassified Streptomyces]WTB61197.1 hypothetical protein OG832_49400 [Streptomyces sp. NBC_00826]WTH96340.1 hypothetical protein OIC43_44925 [Streptomyces sp. NBC_00825]WTI05056.1 hypothetical protein OHA23_44715 [Streptomyces sp. NBC_00822]MCX4870545.1 hypothetical protein [Streptomyces sp. NBC_00906]MCX4901978.1 hypothetical protein [Streptomyces sp. NBC_00892]
MLLEQRAVALHDVGAPLVVGADEGDVRGIDGEPGAVGLRVMALPRIDVGPARRRIAEVLDRYTPEQRELLFDYFAHAAPAYRAATDEIRAAATRRRKPGRKPSAPPAAP